MSYKGKTGECFFGLTLVKELGSGSCGTAYLTNKGTVLKITSSSWEYFSMMEIQNTDDPFLKEITCKVYNVWQEGEKFYIEKEYIPYTFDDIDDLEYDLIHEKMKENPSWSKLTDCIYENGGMRENGQIVWFDVLIRNQTY